MSNCAIRQLRCARVCEHVQRLEIRYTQRVREINLDVEPESLEDTLFGYEKQCAAALKRTFGDEIREFGRLLLELLRVEKRVRYGGEACVYVYDASCGFKIGREFRSEVD